MSNWITYKKKIATRKILNDKRKKNFKLLDRFVSTSYVWNKMYIFKNRDNRVKWGKQDDKEYEELKRLEMLKVASPWTKDRPLNLEEYNDRAESNDNLYRMNDEFDINRIGIEQAIDICREKSSPGIDGIEYKMIKKLMERFKKELLERFNYAFKNCKMFSEWKEI